MAHGGCHSSQEKNEPVPGEDEEWPMAPTDTAVDVPEEEKESMPPENILQKCLGTLN